jgi:hypothetical protein
MIILGALISWCVCMVIVWFRTKSLEKYLYSPPTEFLEETNNIRATYLRNFWLIK